MKTKWCFDNSDKTKDLHQGAQTITCDMAVTDFRAAEEGAGAGTVEMRCVPYDTEGPHWRGTVQFAKGAFTDSLKALAAKEEVAFIQADGHWSDTLGQVASSKSEANRGTVTFDDRDDGLYAEVVLADTTAGRDIYELVSSEVIDSCSVGVFINRYESALDEETDGENMTITEATLDETSFVTRPRFEKAKVKVKSESGRDLAAEFNALPLFEPPEHRFIEMESVYAGWLKQMDENIQYIFAALEKLNSSASSEATAEPKAETAPKSGLALVAALPRTNKEAN